MTKSQLVSHEVRFVDPKPCSVQGLAYESKLYRLAVVRFVFVLPRPNPNIVQTQQIITISMLHVAYFLTHRIVQRQFENHDIFSPFQMSCGWR